MSTKLALPPSAILVWTWSFYPTPAAEPENRRREKPEVTDKSPILKRGFLDLRLLERRHNTTTPSPTHPTSREYPPTPACLRHGSCSTACVRWVPAQSDPHRLVPRPACPHITAWTLYTHPTSSFSGICAHVMRTSSSTIKGMTRGGWQGMRLAGGRPAPCVLVCSHEPQELARPPPHLWAEPSGKKVLLPQEDWAPR